MINILTDSQILPTGEVRSFDAKGRHTTSSRQLLVRAGGGIFIDTPGMREIGLMADRSGLQETFDDIEQLAQNAVSATARIITNPSAPFGALSREGALSSSRHQRYLQFQKELHNLDFQNQSREKGKETPKETGNQQAGGLNSLTLTTFLVFLNTIHFRNTGLRFGTGAREKAYMRRSVGTFFFTAKRGLHAALHVEMIIFRNTIEWSRLLQH